MALKKPADNVRILTAREINRATLARQMLLARQKIPVVKAIERTVAVQAQAPRPPFVWLWTRLQDFRREQLVEALRERTIVRGTAMRGTLFLMSARDFASLRGALQPALARGAGSILHHRAAGFDVTTLSAAGRAFFKKPATFDALRAHLKQKEPKADERAMAYTIRMHLPLVQVPADQPWAFPAAADFALADTWIGMPVSVDPAPPDELVRRYLAALGPATVTDAQIWSGIPSLRDTFDKLRGTLVTFRDARKRELFDLRDAPRPPADTPAPVRFLPEFDNLVISHQDRTRVLPDEYRSRVLSKNLQVRATFLVDGLVAGAWRIDRTKTTASLVLEPFAKLTARTRAALEAEGEALLRFVEPDAATRDIRLQREPRTLNPEP